MKLICIPALKEHIFFVEYSYRNLSSRIDDVQFLIVTPDYSHFQHLLSENLDVKSDFDFIDLSKEVIRSKLNSPKRHLYKWYYQQFLKYSIVNKLNDYSDILILDADTIIISDCIFDCDVIYTNNIEYNEFYFEIINHFFPNNIVMSKSAIVNFMWFNKSLFLKMLNGITHYDNTDWFQIIINYINSSNFNIAFSEYETYANYKFNLINPPLINLKIFRRADLFLKYYSVDNIINIANIFGYDVISFENTHNKNKTKKIIAFFIVCFIEIKLFVIKVRK